MGEHPDRREFVAIEVPEFDGETYEFLFVSDQVAIVKTVAAVRDSYGYPIYIYDDTGTIYNFRNVISFKKVSDG